MKKLIAAILITAALTVLFAVFASASDGVVYTLSDDGDSYILSSYTYNEPEVRIASEYKGLPVSKIASNAFSGNISTYKIIIPDSIKKIEDGAFSAMPSLYEFEASGSYTSVNGVLFTSDKKTLVRYPEARTGEYYIPSGTSVGAYAFSGCRITSLDASGAVFAGKYAFYASDVKNITLSASLRSIGAHAFEKSTVEKIIVPGRTSVSAYAFASCEKLTYADISNASLDGEGAFYSDTSLIAVSFPQDQASVPDMTFAGCTSLRIAPVGKNVRVIGKKAYYGCTALEYASCGSAGYESDSFGLCDKLTPDKNTFAEITQKSAEITLKAGESYTVSGVDRDVITLSPNVRIEDGRITALYEGKADVYAVSHRGGDCAVISITVTDGAGVVESAHPYKKGTYKYSYTVPGSPDRISVTFSTSDMLSSADAVKIQDKNGNLYGTYYGGSLSGKTLFIDGDTVEITLISINAGSYGFRVVSAVPVKSLSTVTKITLPAVITVKAGEKISLQPVITPANAYPKELLYVTDDKDIAAVSNDGGLYGVSAGETQITVYSSFYGVYAKCTVRITSAGEDEFEYEIKDGGAYITGYNGEGGVCTVPPSLGSKETRGINDRALSFSGITELHIPDSLSYLSPSSLDGNSSLTGIYANNTNKYFKTADGALYGKDGRTLVRVPCGIKGTFTVPDSVTAVSDGAFSCCFGIEKIIIGKSVTELSGNAFINCSNLKNITSLSDKFTVIDGALYTGDKKTLVYFPAALNIRAFSVNSGTEKIGAQAFNSAVNLKSVVLPASVSDIDGTALSEALYITEITVNSSNAVYSVYDGALYENNGLKFVPKNRSGRFTVRDTTVKILPYAFYNCAYITEISLSSSVTDIGDYSFGHCTSTDSIYLPGSVKNIGYDAFCGDGDIYVYIPGNAKLTYLSDCTVMCGKDTDVCIFCKNNGIKYKYTYRSEYGLYTVYSSVKAELRVEEEKDPVILSKYRAAAAQSVKAFSVYLLSGGVKLPAGEYTVFRQNTSSKRYYYENGELSEIKADAASVYRRYADQIIELSGDKITPALYIKTRPEKLEYGIYDTLDTSGLSLYYTDESGITTVIDSGYDVSCDMRTEGEKTAVIYYKGLSTQIIINVSSRMLSGVVRITGKAKYGDTLTADTSGVLPKDTELSYQWYTDGKKISGANKNTYVPTENDIGKKLTVKVTSAQGIEGELVSDQVTVGKATAPAPPKPVIESATPTKVTLKKIDGCEYKLSSDSGFKDSNVFDGLTPGETYVFCQRYKETETTEASDVSSVSYEMKKNYKITSDKYFVNSASGAVSLIDPGTTVKTLLSGFNYKEYLSVVKDGKTLSDTDIVGTGCEVRLTVNGELYDKCVIVITGDVNGDGKITITDYLKIKERIQNGTPLSKEKEYSADVNGDGKVTMTDYLRLKYCIQNGENPEQNRY